MWAQPPIFSFACMGAVGRGGTALIFHFVWGRSIQIGGMGVVGVWQIAMAPCVAMYVGTALMAYTRARPLYIAQDTGNCLQLF